MRWAGPREPGLRVWVVQEFQSGKSVFRDVYFRKLVMLPYGKWIGVGQD